MSAKTNKERIDDMDQKIKSLEAQKQALIAREKEKERKERTRRLIQIGGIMTHMGVDTIEKAQLLQKTYNENTQLKVYLDGIIK